jgi:hypothetical protein
VDAGGASLPFTVEAGVVSVTVPRIDTHEAVVFEGGDADNR